MRPAQELSDSMGAPNQESTFKPPVTGMLALLSVAIVGIACATTRTWTPLPDETEAREIASSLAGKTATLQLTPSGAKSADAPEVRAQKEPVVDREKGLQTEELEIRVKELGFASIRGDTATGPRSVALSQVRSISYIKDRGATAALGAVLGAAVVGSVGYVVASSGTSGCSGDSAYACPVAGLAGVGVGILLGATVGALVGQRVTLLVQPAPAPESGAASH